MAFDRSDQKTRIHVVTLLSPGLWDRQAERLSLYDVERSGRCLLAKDNSQTCSLCATYCAVTGGAERDRTADLKLAKLPLSQLSYGPFSKWMVGPGRLELPTLRLSGVRSNHLSYGPMRRRSERQCAPGLAIKPPNLNPPVWKAGWRRMERETKTAASRL